MTTRRSFLHTTLSAAAWVGSAGLTACAGLGGPRVVTLDEGELTALVAKRFPLRQRLVEVLDVEASQPRLRLLPGRNRLALDVALAAHDRLLGSHRQGNLQMDSALRWEQSDQTVRLTQPQVQRLTLGGVSHDERRGGSSNSGGSDGPLARFSRTLVERMLDELVVYRLSAERQDGLRQRGLVPGAVTVTARGVEITLVPDAPASAGSPLRS